ncbi:hypothetical protein ACFVXG_38220 [Kitasatospora sp. NPDC058162]|uniref:hypothetical protein n=1 Tax=Kitasatospora sp. NPDC058162 TaxID=3346362 RepID=UPI0036DD18A3
MTTNGTTGNTQQTALDGPIREYICELLRANLAAEEARESEVRRLEEAGHRIVNGGQTGMDSWEITDWRSGALIEASTNGLDGYDAAADRPDPTGMWFHIDHVGEGVDELQVSSFGLPESLAEALREWLSLRSTPDKDVAAVTGWSADEVQRHRVDI